MNMSQKLFVPSLGIVNSEGGGSTNQKALVEGAATKRVLEKSMENSVTKAAEKLLAALPNGPQQTRNAFHSLATILTNAIKENPDCKNVKFSLMEDKEFPLLPIHNYNFMVRGNGLNIDMEISTDTSMKITGAGAPVGCDSSLSELPVAVVRLAEFLLNYKSPGKQAADFLNRAGFYPEI